MASVLKKNEDNETHPLHLLQKPNKRKRQFGLTFQTAVSVSGFGEGSDGPLDPDLRRLPGS